MWNWAICLSSDMQAFDLAQWFIFTLLPFHTPVFYWWFSSRALLCYRPDMPQEMQVPTTYFGNAADKRFTPPNTLQVLTFRISIHHLKLYMSKNKILIGIMFMREPGFYGPSLKIMIAVSGFMPASFYTSEANLLCFLTTGVTWSELEKNRNKCSISIIAFAAKKIGFAYRKAAWWWSSQGSN